MINPSRARSAAFPSMRWSGHWIAPTPEAVATVQISFGNDVPPHDFSRVLFRKTFVLEAIPASAPLRLTADSRYVLLVNGTEIGRGPIRSQPRRQRYDEYDIADALVTGENTIAVLVTYYGEANAYWQPAAGHGIMGTDALLVLEARLGDELLVSDDSWRVQRSPAFATFERTSIDGVPVEHVDARLFAADWAATGFDDSGWEAATIMRISHIGGLAVSQPPTDPFGALLPRGIAALTGETVAASALLDSSDRPRPDWEQDHPAERVKQVVNTTGGVGSADGDLPQTFALDGGTVRHIGIDFGRILAGFVELDLIAPAGTVVDLFYREKSWVADPGGIASSPNTSARYVARGEADEFRALEINGLRFLHLAVYGDAGEVTITGIRVREYHYPEVGGSFFRSNDAEIDGLYLAGRRTVTMNAFDSYTDCPTREQRAWVGDGVVHQLVHLTTNDDWALARNYVALGNSPREDGMLPMSVVGEVEAGESITIPDWALHWVHGVHNLYRYLGDREEIRPYLPTIEGILRWYETYVDDFGTISDVPEWNLVDWSSVFTGGRSSILTALWARGLREFAELSDWFGNAGNAAWARGRYVAAKAGYEDFWDEGRGRYVDHFADGVRQPASSQHAGAAAIVSGLAPRERWNRIVDGITDPASVVVRSWIGGIDGGYDMQKMIEQSQGIQRVDWDVDREVVKAQPFFSYVVHDAVAAAGQGGKLVDLMRSWTALLEGGYDTFAECWGWGTPVHGWSSTPSRDLIQHVLGIQPAEPGFAVATFAPALGSLTTVDAQVPTPHGPITVHIANGRARIESPVPVRHIAAHGGVHEFGAGVVEIDV